MRHQEAPARSERLSGKRGASGFSLLGTNRDIDASWAPASDTAFKALDGMYRMLPFSAGRPPP
jgi:hypothetical protein